MASEWPVFVELCRVDGGIPQVYDSSNRYRDDLSYGLMEAARAWQAFMQWCDGTAEQWQGRAKVQANHAYQVGYDEGYEDRSANIRG